MNLAYLAPWVLFPLTGFFAEKILGRRIFSPLVNVLITCAVGAVVSLAVIIPYSQYYEKTVATQFYGDLVKRGVETYGQRPPSYELWMYPLLAVVGSACGLLVLYLLARRRPASEF